MGRKPDVLISTYFNRGEKLQDSSNRYSYTCKSCNASFPKGRTSHLFDHLMGDRRCPFLKTEDLAKIAAIQASRDAEKAKRENSKDITNFHFSVLQSPNSLANEDHSSLTPDMPVKSQQGLTGLEALAEASRQVERPIDTRLGDIDQGSEFDLVQSFIDPSLNDIGLANGQQVPGQDLSSIAASASNLEASLPQTVAFPIGEHHDMSQMPWPQPLQSPTTTLTEQLAQVASFGVHIAANPVSAVDDFNPPPSKVAKTRSKFSDARREEVRGVRNKRACIRCRMLRKPVSYIPL
jgi:hypothetical protein